MSSLGDALRFLTILPIPGGWTRQDGRFERCALWFPIVGIIIGAMLAGTAIITQAIFPPAVSVIIIVGVSIFVSGGLHLDGVADTADGMFSSKPTAKILSIMKDSRIGTMGTLALILFLGLKTASLIAIPSKELWRVVFLMTLNGRTILLLGICWGHPIPNTTGLGKLFMEEHSLLKALPLLVAPIIVAIALQGVAGAISYGLVFFTAGAILLWATKRLGGINGDILGTMCETAELFTVLTLCSPYIFTMKTGML